MSQAGSNISTLQRMALTQGVKDFNAANDDLKFIIYKLTINEIFNILQNTNLRVLPLEILSDFEDCLAKIIAGFFILSGQPLGNMYSFSQVIPTLQEAYSHLYAALSVFGIPGMDFDYAQHVQQFWLKLYQSKEELAAL
jgi:hypothetical protein